MKQIMKLIPILICLLVMSMIFVSAVSANSVNSELNSDTVFVNEALSCTNTQTNSPDVFSSPENFITYLKSFDGKYENVLNQYSSLSEEQQKIFLEKLKNFEDIEVSIQKVTVTSTKSSEQYISMDAIFSLQGINLMSIKMDGRYTTSGSMAVSPLYADAYVTTLYVPFVSLTRSSLNSYVSNGVFYENSAFAAVVNVGGLGITSRTFYLEMRGNGYGRTYANTW